MTTAKIIGIDPGHGGKDPGAIGGENIHEADLNWQIALTTIDRLAQAGFVGVLTRGMDEDPPHWVRNNRMETAGARLVISVHCNAVDNPRPHGSMAFYWPGNQRALEIATRILQEFPTPLRPHTSIPWAVVESEPWLGRARGVIAAHSASMVLIECGFVTNPVDLAALTDPLIQAGIADAILAGVSIW